LNGLNGYLPAQAATVAKPSPPAVVSILGAQQAAAAPAEKPAKPATPPSKDPAVATEALKAAAKDIEAYLKSSGRSLEFRVDNDSGRTVVSVRNPQTGELIRQIPSEEVLRIASALGTQSPVLVDTSV
jgi:flagellar protein FlaG